MVTVSVDLAYRSYRDVGIAVIEDSRGQRSVEFRSVGLDGDPSPVDLAEHIARLCEAYGSKTLFLDGPQGWKDEANGLVHCRKCERELNTQGKTGVPNQAKPGNWVGFFQFSISVFDAFQQIGWSRYEGVEPRGAKVAAESYPYAAWRSIGLAPLASKRKCKGDPRLLEAKVAELCETYRLKPPRPPNHDETQALVAGLAGKALTLRDNARLRVSGVRPFSVDGTIREGYIVCPQKED